MITSKLKLTGGHAFAEMLRLHNAAPIFGMAGFQLLPFYEAVRKLGLKHTLINHECCGVFAADAWARLTGRPGICDATLGPGATNLVTGLVESLNAGVPLIVIVGNSNRDHSWKNMTQEARQTDILTPAVKSLIRVEQGLRIPELVRRAYTIATSGRPGPVVLDVPEDVMHNTFEYSSDDFFIDSGTIEIPARRSRPGRKELARALDLLRDAERPIILVGGGVHLSGAYKELQQLSESFLIPVAYTFSGKGAMPDVHPLSVGLFGRWSRIANDLIEKSDCILSVGCKMGEVATKRYSLMPKGVPFIHLDIVSEEIGRTTDVDVALWCDAAEGLDDLYVGLVEEGETIQKRRTSYIDEVKQRMVAWQAEAEPRYESDEQPISMARLIRELQIAMPSDGILVADGGFASHWTGLLYDTTRAGRTYIADRGFASIGYGLPGAIGAQLASPGVPVIGITGDGGFNAVLGELETAKRMSLGFTLVVVNNAASGYIKALQHSMYDGHYQSSDLCEINYADVARVIGCDGIRVTDPAQLGAALVRGMETTDRPTIVDVIVTRDPAKMLPGIDARLMQVKAGDRPA
jgi:acetolactate synthase-1/2/3 large subunit